MINNTKRSFTIIICFALLVLLLAGTGTSAWATPGQDHLRQSIPTPVPRQYVIVLPPQDSGDDYSFTVRPLPDVSCAPPAGCELFAPIALEAYMGTQLVPGATFDPPAEVCYSYTADQAEAVGGAENLAVVYWDDAQAAWIPLDNRRHDSDLMMVCGDIAFVPDSACGLGVTCAISPTGVPVTGNADDEASLSGVTLYATLATVGLLAIGFVARRRINRG